MAHSLPHHPTENSPKSESCRGEYLVLMRSIPEFTPGWQPSKNGSTESRAAIKYATTKYGSRSQKISHDCRIQGHLSTIYQFIGRNVRSTIDVECWKQMYKISLLSLSFCFLMPPHRHYYIKFKHFFDYTHQSIPSVYLRLVTLLSIHF